MDKQNKQEELITIEQGLKSNKIPVYEVDDIRTIDHVNDRMIKTALGLFRNKNLMSPDHRPLTFGSILGSRKMKDETEQATKMLRAYLETWLGRGSMLIIPKEYLDRYGVSESSLPSFMAISDKVTTPRIIGKASASNPKVIRLLGLDPRKTLCPEDR